MVDMSEEQEAYNVWLAMQDIQKMAQGYENAVDLLQTKNEEIESMNLKVKYYEDNINNINNSIWELMYPDDPTDWEYLTQPIVHIKVEIESLRDQLARAEAYIKRLTDDVEWIRGAIDDKCPWCGGLYHFGRHDADCPRQAAVAWLEEVT